jgi:uncharacterized protein YjbI with pentapeptide repeats
MKQKEKPPDEVPPSPAPSAASSTSEDLKKYQQAKEAVQAWLQDLMSERKKTGYNLQLQAEDPATTHGRVFLPFLTGAEQLKVADRSIASSQLSREAYRDATDAGKLLSMLNVLPQNPKDMEAAKEQLITIATNGVRLGSADYYRHWQEGLPATAGGKEREMYLEGALAWMDGVIANLPGYYEGKGGEAPLLKSSTFKPLLGSLEKARTDFDAALIAEQQGNHDAASAKIKSGMKEYNYFDNRFGELMTSAEEDRKLVGQYGHTGAFFVKHGESIMNGIVFLGGMAGKASKTPVGGAAYLTMELYFAAQGASDLLNRYVAEGGVPFDPRTGLDIALMALPAGTLGKTLSELPKTQKFLETLKLADPAAYKSAMAGMAQTQKFLDYVSKTGGGVLMASSGGEGVKTLVDARGMLSSNEAAKLMELVGYLGVGCLVAEHGKGAKPETPMNDFFDFSREGAPRAVDLAPLESAAAPRAITADVSKALSDLSSFVGESDPALREMIARAQQGVKEIDRFSEGGQRELSFEQMKTLITDMRAFSEQKPEYGSFGALADWMDPTYASRLNMESVAPRETVAPAAADWSTVADRTNRTGRHMEAGDLEAVKADAAWFQEQKTKYEQLGLDKTDQFTYNRISESLRTANEFISSSSPSQAQVPTDPVRIFEAGQLAQVEQAQALIALATNHPYATIETIEGFKSGRLSLIAGEDKIYRLGVDEGTFAASLDLSKVSRIAVLQDISELPTTVLDAARLKTLSRSDANLLQLNDGNGARITMNDGTVHEGSLAFESSPGHRGVGIKGSSTLYDLRNVQSIELLNEPNLFAWTARATAAPAPSEVRATAKPFAAEASAGAPVQAGLGLSSTPEALFGPELASQFQDLIRARIQNGETIGTRAELERYASFLGSNSNFTPADFAEAEGHFRSLKNGQMVNGGAMGRLKPIYENMGNWYALDAIKSITRAQQIAPKVAEAAKELEMPVQPSRLPTEAELPGILDSQAKWRKVLGLSEGAALDSPEAKALLQQALRNAPAGVQLDLRGMDLSGMDLRGINGAFSYSNLQNANFRGSQGSANFYAANLGGADFTGARLGGSNFANARTSSAGRPAIFDGADLSGSTLAEADFAGASMRNAGLRDANLDNAKFNGALLQSADLQNASAKGTIFDASDLRGSRTTALKTDEATSFKGALQGKLETASPALALEQDTAAVQRLEAAPGSAYYNRPYGNALAGGDGQVAKTIGNLHVEVEFDIQGHGTSAEGYRASVEAAIGKALNSIDPANPLPAGELMSRIDAQLHADIVPKPGEIFSMSAIVKVVDLQGGKLSVSAAGTDDVMLLHYDAAKGQASNVRVPGSEKLEVGGLADMAGDKYSYADKTFTLNKGDVFLTATDALKDMADPAVATRLGQPATLTTRGLLQVLSRNAGKSAPEISAAVEAYVGSKRPAGTAYDSHYADDTSYGVLKPADLAQQTGAVATEGLYYLPAKLDWSKPAPKVINSDFGDIKLEWAVLKALENGPLLAPDLIHAVTGIDAPSSSWERASPGNVGPLEARDMARELQKLRYITTDAAGIRLTRTGRDELNKLGQTGSQNP